MHTETGGSCHAYGVRTYLAFHGSNVWVIEAQSLADARTEALRSISADCPHLVPVQADEVSVRVCRDGELAGLI